MRHNRELVNTLLNSTFRVCLYQCNTARDSSSSVKIYEESFQFFNWTGHSKYWICFDQLHCRFSFMIGVFVFLKDKPFSLAIFTHWKNIKIAINFRKIVWILRNSRLSWNKTSIILFKTWLEGIHFCLFILLLPLYWLTIRTLNEPESKMARNFPQIVLCQFNNF